jgi:hypothetical protein
MKWFLKGLVVVFLAVLTTLVGFILWYRWDCAKNRGFTFGYWGEYNTVSNALVHLPGVTILSSFYNHDITLEEFGFDIRTSEGREVHLGFSETDPIREMSGEKLSRALSEKIQKQASNNTVSLTESAGAASAGYLFRYAE